MTKKDENMESKHKNTLTNDGVATITVVDKAEGQENAQNVTANFTVTTTYV